MGELVPKYRIIYNLWLVRRAINKGDGWQKAKEDVDYPTPLLIKHCQSGKLVKQ